MTGNDADTYVVMWLFGLGLAALVLGAIGSELGRKNGRTALGFWLGFLLGPIGLLIIAVLDRPSAEYNEQSLRDWQQQTRKLAIAEAIRRRPELSADDPETLSLLSEAAKAIESEWEIKRLQDAVLADVPVAWDGSKKVVKPLSGDSEWDGSQWVSKPTGPESQWDGARWVAKPRNIQAEWNGSRWVAKPANTVSEWDGSGWVVRPEDKQAEWDGTGWALKPTGTDSHWDGESWALAPRGPSYWSAASQAWTRPWYAKPLVLPLWVGLLILVAVAGFTAANTWSEARAAEAQANELEAQERDPALKAIRQIGNRIDAISVLSQSSDAEKAVTQAVRGWQLRNPKTPLRVFSSAQLLRVQNFRTGRIFCVELAGLDGKLTFIYQGYLANQAHLCET